MSFTTTTYYSLKKPEVGGSTDLWGGYINENFDTISTQLNSLNTSLLGKVDTTSLGTYVTADTTGLNNYTQTSSITLETANNVTVTSLAANDFLVYTGSNWANKSKTDAQISLLPTYGPAGSLLRVATGGTSVEWATVGFQASYTLGTTDPISGQSNGDLFFNTATNTLKIYNNTWVSVVDTDATTPTTDDIISLSIALG